MNRKIATLLILLCAVAPQLASQRAMAQTINSGWSTGAHFGSTGIGVHGAKAISPILSVSGTLDVLGLRAQSERTIGGSALSLDLQSTVINGSSTGNIHPFGNGFKMAAGLMFGLYDVEGARSGQFDDGNGGQTSGQLSYQVGLQNRALPYLGIGWQGRRRTAGLSFYGDAGLGWAGGTRSSGRFSLDCSAFADAALAACRAEERQSQAELAAALNDVPNLEFYPVVRLGISYNF